MPPPCSGVGVRGLGSWVLQPARGRAFSNGFGKEEGPAKAVFSLLRAGNAQLDSWFLLPLFQKGSFDMCLACQMVVCKKKNNQKRPESMGEGGRSISLPGTWGNLTS